MYEVFDSFIGADTWLSGHDYDHQRFYTALAKVVWSDQFDPDEMARYMREKKEVPFEDRESVKAQTIAECCHDAGAIKDFLKCNGISKNT
jgi:hypothetical protein